MKLQRNFFVFFFTFLINTLIGNSKACRCLFATANLLPQLKDVLLLKKECLQFFWELFLTKFNQSL